jgi:hypothetical protein
VVFANAVNLITQDVWMLKVKVWTINNSDFLTMTISLAHLGNRWKRQEKNEAKRTWKTRLEE